MPTFLSTGCCFCSNTHLPLHLNGLKTHTHSMRIYWHWARCWEHTPENRSCLRKLTVSLRREISTEIIRIQCESANRGKQREGILEEITPEQSLERCSPPYDLRKRNGVCVCVTGVGGGGGMTVKYPWDM